MPHGEFIIWVNHCPWSYPCDNLELTFLSILLSAVSFRFLGLCRFLPVFLMEFEDGGGPWMGKKGKGLGSGLGFNHRVVKFFVSNIPDGCRPWDLSNAFRGYGDIAGAFIAKKKKDKEGRKFGFVSFKGVLDAAGLEASMVNMKLGGNKLLVNVAKFAKENGGSVIKNVGGSIRPEGYNNRKVPVAESLQKKPVTGGSKGRSFVDILLNKSSPSAEMEDVIEVEPSLSALSDKVGRALVGRALNVAVLRSLKVSLREVGFQDIVIQYLGGLSVLLSFKDELEAKSFAEDRAARNQWFSSIDPWVGQSFPFERLAWINVYGVPPPSFL
ncbi:putative RNA recognition motif domain, nucleotide-binding alpha-beta plait domain superfamily [Helianthus debilis subsp. tardiflorus]